MKIVIQIHSFVDVITNSSTELFVLDTDKSVEAVKEILQAAIDLENKVSGTDLQFEDIFDEPYQEIGKSSLHGWDEYFNTNIEDGIVIVGAHDNSIPWWMFEFIESTFGWKTERHHLG